MLFSLLFLSNIVVGNASLRFISVSFVQIVRSIIPGVTMVLSYVLLKKTYANIVIYSLVLRFWSVPVDRAGDAKRLIRVTGFVSQLFSNIAF